MEGIECHSTYYNSVNIRNIYYICSVGLTDNHTDTDECFEFRFCIFRISDMYHTDGLFRTLCEEIHRGI